MWKTGLQSRRLRRTNPSLFGHEHHFVVEGGGAGDHVNTEDAAALVRGGDELGGDFEGVEFSGEQGAAGEAGGRAGLGDELDQRGAGLGLQANNAA